MLPEDYSQQWVMNPTDVGHITNSEVYEVLLCVKVYVDACKKSQDTMYKQIADILDKGGIISDDKLKKDK